MQIIQGICRFDAVIGAETGLRKIVRLGLIIASIGWNAVQWRLIILTWIVIIVGILHRIAVVAVVIVVFRDARLLRIWN